VPAVKPPDPKATYRPWEPFATVVDGEQYVLPLTSRLAGDHPVVQAMPGRFVRHDAPDDEVVAVRAAQRAEDDERNRTRERRQAEADRKRLGALRRMREGVTGAAARSRAADERRAQERRADVEDQAELAARKRREQTERDARDAEIAALQARGAGR
jgi:hypothetical protein